MRLDVIQATVPESGGLDSKRREAIENAGSPGTIINIRLPSGAPTSITSVHDDALAVPGVIREARSAQEEGADAVIVNCTADTGVEALKEVLEIPVVGVSEAAFHLAAQLSLAFSVLTFAQRIEARFFRMAHEWGMQHRLRSVRSVETPLENIEDHRVLAESLARESTRCVKEDGAHLIILGCTDFELAADATAGLLAAHGISVPLARPYAIGVRQAESLVAMGLSQAALSYPAPRTG